MRLLCAKPIVLGSGNEMAEEKDTMSFRIFPSGQEDNGKTIARMSTELMRKFQIDSEDILKISGCQTAYAICLPLDICKTAPKDHGPLQNTASLTNIIGMSFP